MELNPTSEKGKRLNEILIDWMRNFPDATKDTLTRVFLMYAFRIENQDALLDALYGQRVLEQPQLDSSHETQQQRSQALSKVRHAVVTCVNTRRVKELIVALEWSKNDSLLSDILRWSEEAGNQSIMESARALPTMVLAPQRAAKSFALMLSSARAVSQSERRISLNGQPSKVFHVCRNCDRIIIGFVNGQIKIYDSVELQCEAILPYYENQSAVTCFQCTCTEIIAGYEDGNICAWDMKSGMLTQKISVKGPLCNGFPYAMQWQNLKLVVAATVDRIQIWQYTNSNFTLLGGWNVRGTDLRPIEFDGNYVILQDFVSSIHVYCPNGKFIRRIESLLGNMVAVAYRNGKIITGGADGILRIWDVQTGVCLQDLDGHPGKVDCVQLHKDTTLLTASSSGTLTVWDMTATALLASPDTPASAFSREAPSRSFVVEPSADDSGPFAFGRNFVVRASQMPSLRVITFS